VHLQKICINGFKSFADPVELEFDKGVTGIVGPNGSGKSNVIDAVRWVMGEQNAKTLRGEKGTDIIFSGSTKRKQLGMAEVTLVFNNSDSSAFCPPEYQHESEIRLTRRIYQDGVREYLINGKNCRLKDIIGFFTATGLGGRSYSMIQQGQVDRILQAKPEDIRLILEEAAGTMVFRKRREEAETKLRQTEENLSRISDILREIHKQKTVLQKQAAKAMEYRESSIELKDRETSYLLHQFHKHSTDKNLAEKSIEEATQGQSASLERIGELETELAKVQEEIEKADPGLRHMQEKISLIREQIARAENTIQNSDKNVVTHEGRLAEIAESLIQEQADFEVLQAQLQSSEEENAAAGAETGELEKILAEVQTKVDMIDERKQVFQDKLDDFEDELSNLHRLAESNKVRQESIEKEFDKNAEQRDLADEKLTAIKLEQGQLQILLDAAELKVASEKKGIEKDLFRKRELKEKLEKDQDSHTDILEKLGVAKENYITIKSRMAALQDQLSSAEGPAQIAALVKEHGRDGFEFLGVLTEKFNFKDNYQELSIRARKALEKWLERVVLPTVQDVSGFLEFTKNQDAGGFAFSCLEDIPEVDASWTDWAAKFDLQELSDFAGLKDSRLQKLLATIFYAADLQLDPEVLKSLPRGAVLVTAGGLVCSGSTGDGFIAKKDAGDSLVQVQAKLAKLEKQFKSGQSEVAEIQSKLDALTGEMSENRTELSGLDDFLQSQNQGVVSVLTELEGLRQQEEFKRQTLFNSETQLVDCDQKETELKKEKIDLRDGLIGLQNELSEAKQEKEHLLFQMEEIESEKEGIWKAHSTQRDAYTRKKARAEAMLESLTNTKAQSERMQKALDRRYEERSRLEFQIAKVKEDKETASGDIKGYLLEREELESEFAAKREENSELITKQRELDTDLRKLHAEQSKVQKALNEHQIKIEKAKSNIEALSEQAIEKYQIEDLGIVAFAETEGYDFAGEAKSVARLRSKLDKIGPINMMAIDEFDRLTERETFIFRNREEILKSIELLSVAIREIEQTSKDKFLVIFHTINHEFGQLFPILFPSGEARLQLTEPEDPLNSGVEIMCRLPGKKMQRLNLFSGGEKALTAMALIFGLLKTKPTPFCFLDEVDAALDEANVARYNKVLLALASRFQFIVITHRRRTMEVLDTLYGVTMQEPGVSKIVGVNMNADLPSHLQKAFKPGSGPASNRRPEGVQGATVG